MSELIEVSPEGTVRVRYAKTAQAEENGLCCPVDYDQRYLKEILKEVIEWDYGCGDPSRFLKKGETVLGIGSGRGKICFVASQVVGSEGNAPRIRDPRESMGSGDTRKTGNAESCCTNGSSCT